MSEINITDEELIKRRNFKSGLRTDDDNRLLVTSLDYPEGKLLAGSEVDDWLEKYVQREVTARLLERRKSANPTRKPKFHI